MRIFVDVDDTLYLYQGNRALHPYGRIYGEPFNPNWELIARLLILQHKTRMFDSHGIEIFVWSGGGVDYAEQARSEFLPFADHVVIKDPSLLHSSDIVIDDMKLDGRGTHYLPQDFGWFKQVLDNY